METMPHCPTQCLSTKRQCEMKFEENPVPQRKEHLRLEKRKSPKSFRRGESEVATQRRGQRHHSLSLIKRCWANFFHVMNVQREKCQPTTTFRSNQVNYKEKVWWDKRRRRRNQENEKGGIRAQTTRDPNLRYFDLWREGTPGCSEIHLQEHPLGGRRHRRKCQKYPYLSFSLARKMKPILPQHSQMIYNILGALSPNQPQDPFSQETLSSATNCVLMSPTPVYFYDEKTAKPQVSRSSLQCLSWLH